MELFFVAVNIKKNYKKDINMKHLVSGQPSVKSTEIKQPSQVFSIKYLLLLLVKDSQKIRSSGRFTHRPLSAEVYEFTLGRSHWWP